MQDVDVSYLPWLFGLALVASTIDAMAGGGGLLTIPGLMATGLNPVSVIATNILQGTFSSFSATLHFWRKGQVNLKDQLFPALAAFVGSIGGAISLSFVNPAILKILVPFLLIGISFWILFSPNLGKIPRTARLTFLVFTLTFIPLIGFYSGFFGPGTGTFFALGGVALLGLTLDKATIHAKIYNFMSCLGGLLFFAFNGHIVWVYGGVMAIGTIIGGNIGARLVLRHGTGLIKPMLVVMSLAMSLKLLWQQGLIQKAFGS